MQIDRTGLNEHELAFLDYILQQFPDVSEPSSLYRAIQAAFPFGEEKLDQFDQPISPALVTSMAKCLWIVAQNYSPLDEHDWTPEKYAEEMRTMLKALLGTMLVAFEEKKYVVKNELPCLGNFSFLYGMIWHVFSQFYHDRYRFGSIWQRR